MTRKLKVLGLVLAAVFAMSAMAASSASAQTNAHFVSDGPVTLTGTQTAGAPTLANSTTHFGDAVVCPGSTFTGHQSNTTPHASIPSGSTTATITPHYKNCKVNSNGLTAHIDMNGCDYELTNGPTTGGADTYGATTHIDCPTPTTHIKKTITFFGVACTTIIPEQTVTGAHLRDTTNGHLDLEGSFTGLRSSRSGFGCATESEEEGVLHVDMTIAGHNGGGSSTALSISG